MPVYYDSDEYAPEETGGYSFTLITRYKGNVPNFYAVLFKKNGKTHRTDGPSKIEWLHSGGDTLRDYSITGWAFVKMNIIAIHSLPLDQMPLFMNKSTSVGMIVKDRLEGNTGITLISSKPQCTLDEIIRRATETPTKHEIEQAKDMIRPFYEGARF